MSIEATRSEPVLPDPSAPESRFWTRQRVAEALAEHAALGSHPGGPERIGRVWTDTRTLRRGDLFVALSGANFDAHNFLRDAVAAGAAALVVSRAEKAAGLGVPVYVVHDTVRALGALARYRRLAWNGPVIGVVGTNGKTSTKELLRAAIESRLDVHATHLNLNNLVGVPQTLLAIPDHADAAVVEMGTNQPGEIAQLRDVAKPNVVVVTSIAEEHLEGLGDLAGVMREEMSACDGVPVVVVPLNQPDVQAEAARRARRTVVAGLADRAAPGKGEGAPAGKGGSAASDGWPATRLVAERWALDEEGRGKMAIGKVEVEVPLRGVHNLRNAALALAVARELGIALEDAARGIAAMSIPPMRSNVEKLGGGRAILINDAYNSNPGSARAALELLLNTGAAGPGGKRQRVAVLGSMLELGPAAPALHDEIARAAVSGGIDLIAGVGEFAAALRRVGAPADRVIGAADPESLWPQLEPRLSRDAVILLKGSRGVRLERLVPHLAKWAATTK